MKTRNKVALIAVAAMTATVSSAGIVGAQDAGSDVKIGAVLKTLANPYWVAMKDGIEARAAELGVEVTVQAATDESAIEEQTTILQTMSGQDFTCFLVAPITGNNLIQPLVDITAAGTPVVNVDAPFDQEALDAFHLLSRMEGIIPALETAHAIAHLRHLGSDVQDSGPILVCLSGRGDKDVAHVARVEGTDLTL